MARVRSHIDFGTEKVEKITYRIATLGPDLMVDDLRPPGYLPIGTSVKLPILIRAYARKNGAAYSLSIARPMAERGEEF